MKKPLLIALIFMFPITGITSTLIDPLSFEKIWLQNNQRNLVKRYHYYNDLVQTKNDHLYLIGVDAGLDKKIKTSAGDKDAIIDRINIHYQSPEYLFLVDWFSAIPQPQTTEGFTYGDLVVGKTWDIIDNNSYLTLGLRQKSIPNKITVGSDVVFNAVNNATKEEYSAFFHFNYLGYDLGTYYSEENAIEATAFHIPILRSDHQKLTSTLYYYGKNTQAQVRKQYEISLDYQLNKHGHNIQTGININHVPDINKYGINNIFAKYSTPPISSISYFGGIYHYVDIESKESSPGIKLGFAWQSGEPENLLLNFTVQQNAFGDFNALIIRDEPIVSFTLTTGIDDLF